MVVTVEQVRAEHEAALAALTAEQKRALHRLEAARQRSNFNHRWPSENLTSLFEKEAAVRSGVAA